MLNRWDIINHLIKKNNYKSYLEIGYYKGWSFDNVNCEEKTAVDPNPCQSPDQESAPYGKGITGSLTKEIIFKITSDEFFSKLVDTIKYDIIFIDGLHEAGQVLRDIENSIKHLAEGGTIVMHDCNPPKYEHTTTGIDGCWTGDTWKAAVKFQDYHEDWYDFCCVDADWGVGIIRKREYEVSSMNPHSVGVLFGRRYDTEWEAFDKNREGLLNLITEEEFLKRVNQIV